LDREVAFEIAYSSEDARAATARLRAGNLAFLFAGSASVDDQAALLDAEIDVASAVLVAPRKIAPEFLDGVNPQFAIVFAGRGARDKPSADLLAALSRATILRTDERGSIEMIVDGASLAVRTAR
jgi:beta-lactamase superfamily II metal-dependent hydrolase